MYGLIGSGPLGHVNFAAIWSRRHLRFEPSDSSKQGS